MGHDRNLSERPSYLKDMLSNQSILYLKQMYFKPYPLLAVLCLCGHYIITKSGQGERTINKNTKIRSWCVCVCVESQYLWRVNLRSRYCIINSDTVFFRIKNSHEETLHPCKRHSNLYLRSTQWRPWFHLQVFQLLYNSHPNTFIYMWNYKLTHTILSNIVLFPQDGFYKHNCRTKSSMC